MDEFGSQLVVKYFKNKLSRMYIENTCVIRLSNIKHQKFMLFDFEKNLSVISTFSFGVSWNPPRLYLKNTNDTKLCGCCGCATMANYRTAQQLYSTTCQPCDSRKNAVTRRFPMFEHLGCMSFPVKRVANAWSNLSQHLQVIWAPHASSPVVCIFNYYAIIKNSHSSLDAWCVWRGASAGARQNM